MSGKLSFEQLCAGGTGYACDERSMVKLSETESFDDIKFKLVTKCETNLLFLRSPSATVSHFTLDVVPIYNKSSLASAWRSCEQKGFDGLHAIAHLDQSNIPKNGCSTKYTFLQFVDSVIRAIEHHFMFQRYNPGFAMNALNLWNLPTDKDLQSCLIVYAWKFDRLPEEELLSRSLLSQKNSSSVDHMENLENSGEEERRKSLPVKSASNHSTGSKRGRRSIAPVRNEINKDDSTSEDDPEISFKQRPSGIMPKAVYLPEQLSHKQKQNGKPKVTEEEPMDIADITLGFEKDQPKRGGRKSSVRKSLAPDWPESEKKDVLFFFDNLNPSQTEQTSIALTCKYASMQYDRELPSKLLYQWVQKKGRPNLKTYVNYELPEKEQREATLEFFRKLNDSVPETSRVAFTCKFLHTQFGLSITSKDFYNWLNDKGKRMSKRR